MEQTIERGATAPDADIPRRMRAAGWRLHLAGDGGEGTAWVRWVNDGTRSHVMICKESRRRADARGNRWFVGRHANNGTCYVEVGAPDLERCLAIWDAIPLLDERRTLDSAHYDGMSVADLRHSLLVM